MLRAADAADEEANNSSAAGSRGSVRVTAKHLAGVMPQLLLDF